MKIKIDFVTNSSSTSFVIICSNSFELHDFLDYTGILEDSNFKDVFVALFTTFERNMSSIRDYYEKHYRRTFGSFEEFVKSRYSEALYERILKAESDGKQVYFGELRSDEHDVEAFFCQTSFVLESEKFYLNAAEYYW